MNVLLGKVKEAQVSAGSTAAKKPQQKQNTQTVSTTSRLHVQYHLTIVYTRSLSIFGLFSIHVWKIRLDVYPSVLE